MKNPAILLICVLVNAPSAMADLSGSISTIQAVDKEGKGNAAAGKAWQELAAADPAQLPQILAAMKGANLLAKNYLQSAVLAIAEKAAGANQKLPAEPLTTYLEDTTQDPLGRKLAYDMLVADDSARREVLLPKFLQDPSPLLRREAVQRLMDLGDDALKTAKAEETKEEAARDQAAIKKHRETATSHYQAALEGAREEDQIKAIAEKLKDLGQKPDLLKHFGFLTDWKILGPFHNDKRAGFDEVFPPEKEIATGLKLDAVYAGKKGEVKWKNVTVTDEFGILNFNKELETLKEVTAYATTDFNSPADQPAEIRLGCGNAWKIWLNGAYIFGRDEYHRGFEVDQYKLPIQLKKGRNTLVVKCCQNEEVQTWTVEWRFQLRLTDAIGTPLPQAK